MKRTTVVRGLAGIPLALATLTDARAQDKGILILGTPNDSAAEVFYAKELDLYRKAGLDSVVVQALENPGAAVAAVVGGTAAVAPLSVPGIAIARSHGIPIVIIAPTSVYRADAPTTGVIVLNESAIRRASDLNGKTIATRDLGNLAYYGTLAWLDKNGANAKSVKWIELIETQAMAAMQNGRVDAAAITEPALDDALQSGARMLGPCYDAIGDGFVIGVYITTEDYARQNPRLVKQISNVILQAGTWANRHHVESAKILGQYAQVTISANATRVRYAETIRTEDIQPVLNILTKYGVLKVPMKAADLFAAQVRV